MTAIILTTTGCASKPPTIGDDIARDRDQYSAIKEKWSDGEDLVNKGLKKVKKGEKQVRDGKANILDGEDMIERGKRMMRDSELEYDLKKNQLGSN